LLERRGVDELESCAEIISLLAAINDGPDLLAIIPGDRLASLLRAGNAR